MTESEHLVNLGRTFSERTFSLRLFFYVTKTFATYMTFLVLAFFLILTVCHVTNDLNDFQGKSIASVEIVTYFLALLVHKTKYVFPMCALLATMKTVADMCKYNEMSALRCMGISLLQIFMPFLTCSLILVVIQFISTEIVAPIANEYASGVHEAAKSIRIRHGKVIPGKRVAKRKAHLAYRNASGRRDWSFDSINRSGACTDVFIQQFDEDKKILWELRADTGSYDSTTKKWTMTNVRRTCFKENQLWPIVGPLIKVQTIEELDEVPQSIDFFAKVRVSEDTSIGDLWRILRDPAIDVPQPTLNILWTSFCFRLFFPFACVISVLLGVPMAVTTQRTSAMKNFLIGVTWMVAFYVIAQCFVVLGNDPRVPPVIAGGLPVIVFAIIGTRNLLRKL